MLSCVVVGVCVLSREPALVPERTRADKPERWCHDLYVEEEQMPRKDWEKRRVSVV